MSVAINDRTEWLETDGLGGFASGTTSGIRTRRYHGLLLSAVTPPTGRYMLVNGVDVWLRTPEGEFPLALQRYAPSVTTDPRGVSIERFEAEPWPRWVFQLKDGTRVENELCMTKGSPRTVLRWRLANQQAGVRLIVRPLLSGRDYHSLHHENPGFRFDPEVLAGAVRWSPYPGVPGIAATHNGLYRHQPTWYRNFQYDQERERGLDSVEDLAAPGVFEFDLSAGMAELVLAATEPALQPSGGGADASQLFNLERTRREQLGSALERAADHYLVRGGRGTTIIAGYPWFADWGRDTFISVRGLCLATGRLDDAREILLGWANSDSGGLLPNRFPDQGEMPEYNSVDAALWFVIAAAELISDCRAAGCPLSSEDTRRLRAAVLRVVAGYAGGTQHGIRMEEDGLLTAGEPGLQLTWMDARVGSRVITPRIGKPVEIQALWLNALEIASRWDPQWSGFFELGRAAFERRFWNEADGCLFDVIDVDHVAGATDASCRPNQILAVGGLPVCLLSRGRARRLVDRVEEQLLTPIGLRSLAPGHGDYAPRYAGGPSERDAVYHQGTVWPWLLGPFVEAWSRVRGDSPAVRAEARSKFLAPLLGHRNEAGLGHISEVADAEPPHTPSGCPFQAWSLGEALRLDRRVLGEGQSMPVSARRRTPTPARRSQVVQTVGVVAAAKSP